MTISPEHSLPFGCYEPSALQSCLIAIGGRLPRSWAGRRVASLIRSVLKRYSGRPIDLVRLGSRMRLYPRSNSSEKRLMATPQFFDAVEIALLEKQLTPDFVFLDIGANAGAYTLFVANRVGRGGRVIAVEPHPTALARLHCNLALNEIDWAKVVPAALSSHDGSLSLFVNERNIGSSSLLSGRRPDLATRAIQVDCRSLTSLISRRGTIAHRRHQARCGRCRRPHPRTLPCPGASLLVAALFDHRGQSLRVERGPVRSIAARGIRNRSNGQRQSYFQAA